MFKILFSKLSFSFDGTSVISTVSSNYDHYFTSLGSIQNVPIALGGAFPSPNKHVESLRGGSWRIMENFAFVNNYIIWYSFVTFHGDLYLFGKIYYLQLLRIKFNLGGRDDGSESNMVAKMGQNSFDENGWTMVGNLLSGRYAHRSIVIGNQIFHIGGGYIE